MSNTIRRAGLAASAVALLFATVACGGDNSAGSGTSPSATTSSAPETSTTPSDAMADPAADLVGPGCADYAKAVPSGKGSVEGMAADPVAVAASNNPLLKTLVASVSGKLNPKVNLVDTLNGGEFTVFAPVDTAFAKIPAATIGVLKKDDKLLTKILTYHVIAGQLAPDAIVGEHRTVETGNLTVSGTPDALTIGKAKVICGGVKTANATVYLIDSVLMPPAS